MKSRDVAIAKIQDRLLRLAAGILNVNADDIDIDGAFSENGFEPVSLSELGEAVSREFSLDLMMGVFSTYSTLGALAKYVLERLQSEQGQGMTTLTMGSDKCDGMGAMDALLAQVLWSQLHTIGLFEAQRLDAAAMKARFPERYGRWLDVTLKYLLQYDYLSLDGDDYLVNQGALSDVEAAWSAWDEMKALWLCEPGRKAQVILVEHTLRALPDILSGNCLATDILFPDASMERVEGVYKDNPQADYFNDVLADTIVAYIEARLAEEPEARLRIIEVGAGTGGTTARILPKLKPYQAYIDEYCYTDLSRAFLLHAEKTYGRDNPFLCYRIFDVESPAWAQGIDAGSYDLVLATNVLHATRNIRQTLRNVKTVLQRNGLILVNELISNTLFAHLTFGLLEGWWLYEDHALRIPGCPGLSPGSWARVLEDEGFRSIFFPVKGATDLGQQVIVAESDGVIRQRKQTKRHTAVTKQTDKGAEPDILDRHKSRSWVDAASKDIIAPPTSVMSDSVDATDDMIKAFVRGNIVEKLCASLRINAENIDAACSFADYGVDSISAVQLVQAINASLGIELKSTHLFDHSSVDRLSDYILSQYKDVLLTELRVHPGQDESQLAAEGAAPRQDTAIVRKGQHTEDLVCDGDGTSKSSGVRPADKLRLETTDAKIVQRKRLYKANSGQASADNKSIVKEPIAIIGMSGRFAKSDTVAELWEHMASGTDLVGDISRWDLLSHYKAHLIEKPDYCTSGSALDDIDRFDPLFFNISTLEASYMDPQQRLFLEESWKALEDSGYAGSAVQGRQCGVYVGCNPGDYRQLFKDVPPPQSMWGNASSIVPSRIAYFLDLQGPAVAIDTACSSSLVSIHLACQGLWSGETELALAGGVSVQATPDLYVSAERAQMLSPTGRCHTFDDRADGFVPGEGVGVVVLKRLREAAADGDHIHGVIRGSGINQDGTTNGITAPSANSQERLERQVYDTFGINPEQIQMVEAHGTGTKLGDPIEFEALTRAFRHYTDKAAYCALGSIKTNIGHATPAAGVAGLIKVLLSLQHKRIPPSLHYEKGNADIEFEGSPFYVNTQLREWPADAGDKRRAAISAFGFSGTNAHMVIEEAPVVERSHSEKPGYLIVLSARTAEQLRQQATQLASHIEAHPQVDCGDLSFTLLLGRKHFAHRLACVARDRNDLQQLLGKWLTKGKLAQVYVSALNEKELREKPSLKRYGGQCIEQCRNLLTVNAYLEDLATIADLYIQGYALDYAGLFAGEPHSRLSLPTYPFARERYWVAQDSSLLSGEATSSAGSGVLHPLLHRNSSDLTEHRYTTLLTGQEFFLADHVIKGQRLLPGVAYLEMARAALSQAAGGLVAERYGYRLKNMVWARPVVVGPRPVSLHIALIPEESGEVSYEIYSEAAEFNAEPIVHSQGIVTHGALQDEEVLDLKGIQQGCQEAFFDAEQCYEAYRAVGVDYGRGHRGIEALHVGSGQALAKLALPSSLASTKDQYVLHPCLMDSALQGTIGLRMGVGVIKPALPFSMNEVEVVGDCGASAWAWVRYSEGCTANDRVLKFDIDLCDETGRVCVRMRGFSSRVLEGEVEPADDAGTTGALLLYPEWEPHAVDDRVAIPVFEQHHVLVCGVDSVPVEALQTQLPGCRLQRLRLASGNIAARYESAAVQVFEALQRLLQAKPRGQVLVQIVVPGEGESQLFAGLSGLLKTAVLENPKVIGQLHEIPVGENSVDLIEQLRIGSGYPQEPYIRHCGRQRWIARWREAGVSNDRLALPWKAEGVYLITGGAGGLGLLFAQEISEQAAGARLLLTGRSALPEEKRERLTVRGAALEYLPMDVADADAVNAVVEDIQHRYGRLDGIIHSAGVNCDNFILKKCAQELRDVLAPKVAGLVNLDIATRTMALDFFVCFAAGAGAMGNAGQADYAAANAFMDHYAAYRNGLVEAGERQGRTLALDWPLWKKGGMKVDAATEERLLQNMGVVAMDTPTGIQTFYHALGSGQSQVMVMAGLRKRLRALFLAAQPPVDSPAAAKRRESDAVSSDGDAIQERVVQYLKAQLSSIIGTPANRIDAEAPMDKYGIDSIMVMQLTNQLETVFGSLPKTLFFEYQNIRELSGYFLDTYGERLNGILGAAKREQRALPASEIAVVPTPSVVLPVARGGDLHRRGKVAAAIESSGEAIASDVQDIAIIGLSGRYPKADNVQAFWENLRGGKDCITEIPPGRWDHSPYFDKDKGKPGKTYSKWGGFINGVDQFDPLFFNISPLEAESMDPQERLFLQCVYETIEDAGYTRETLGDRVGVYVGVMYEEYQLFGAQETVKGQTMALAGSPSSIANRVSYFCDFHGPSLAVDSMCSSSLTTIHLACQSLRQGECKLAIAGGVNVSIHPNKYLILGQGQFASSKGRCESFGRGGDGYVPGEGVGAIVLKPKWKAIEDGDHIYGVIKGTAINHGGKTNGYSVPNPRAQADVIDAAFTMAGVDPRTVSYIEAHGTGTSLGDPVEIAGLGKAFQRTTSNKQYCAIGSAKSNIGHCESAAGIAGVTKVLLQMRHGELAPSLHAETLNPNIDFENSPFIVQRELSEWKRPLVTRDGETCEYPRIAGISSFGAGGSNAHVIIEEYRSSEPECLSPMVDEHNPVVIVLSAKSEAQLRQQASRLLVALSSAELCESSLADIAYTLQVGREALEWRLGLLAGTLPELREKLRAYVKRRTDIVDMHYGQVKGERDNLVAFAADEELHEVIEKWLTQKKYGRLLELWVQGLSFDWNGLYGEIKPRRISLPTYPFANERYWFSPTQAPGEQVSGSMPMLHPLLQENTSDLYEQRYSSTFNGKEFFLADHRVQGRCLLPGVAYLEMACEAVARATGACHDNSLAISLKNVVWAEPVVMDEATVQVHIGLSVEDNGDIGYEIYSDAGNASDTEVVHGQGSAMTTTKGEAPQLDLAALQMACNRDTLTAQACYDDFREMGLDYGPGHQGLQHVHVGEGQVLARLVLPSPLAGSLTHYRLHPSLMDSALQAMVGFNLSGGKRTPFIPFALDTLEVYGAMAPALWVHVRFSPGSHAGDSVQKFDVDLSDDTGRVCVRMKGFTTRSAENAPVSDKPSNLLSMERPDQQLVGNVMLTPVWDTVPITRDSVSPPAVDVMVMIAGGQEQQGAVQRHYPNAVFLDINAADTMDVIAKKLDSLGVIDHILWVAPDSAVMPVAEEAVIEVQNRGVLPCFRIIKALLALGYEARALDWTVITIQAQAVQKNDEVNPAHASVHGLMGSMAKEYPNWRIRLIDLAAADEWPWETIFALPPDRQGNAWGYRGREWFQQTLLPSHPYEDEEIPYRQGGVYLVIGGAGGIGEAWSELMIKRYRAQIVWIGRREKDADIQGKLDRLAGFGPTPEYITADATDKDALVHAYAGVKQRHSRVHGVIHSALVLLDQSLAKMEEERFMAGLSAKVDISVRMAQVFADEPLDFIVFFSSLVAFTKSPGQSNYAAGCTFKDAFAHRLSREWPCAVKVMNWGYWGGIGIVAAKEYRERMARLGVGSIEMAEGMDALDSLLAGPLDQIALIKTTKPLAMDNLNSDERCHAYVRHVPPNLQTLSEKIIDDGARVASLRLEEIRQREEMEALLGKLLMGQLQSLGFVAQAQIKLEALKTRLGIAEVYSRWLEESLRVLVAKQYLSYDGLTYTVNGALAVDVEATWAEWASKKTAWLRVPSRKAQVALVETTLRLLPDILTGRRLATDVMFPNASMALVEGIYKDNPLADYFNEVLAEDIVAYLKRRLAQDPSTRIRMLEIGAGTGGTTAIVLAKLKPYQAHIQEYCYSDLSQAFLLHGEETYGPGNPFLRYRIFDVESPLAPQGIQAGSYDIVIAANVLHATKNIRQTLRNAKAALRRNGVILLNELGENSLFAHLTFGLLEGWWLYEDPMLRMTGSPGLLPETWQSVLEGEGFRPVVFPARAGADLGQQIIMAESDGVVRQKQSARPMARRETAAATSAPNRREPATQRSVAVMQEKSSDAWLWEKSTAYLKRVIGETLKIPSHKIDTAAPFETYGIDSIIVVRLTNVLREVFGDVSSTIFFEHQNIDALTAYLLSTHKAELVALLGMEEPATQDTAMASADDHVAPPMAVDVKQGRDRSKRFLINPSAQKIESQPQRYIGVQDVAIVGLSGRYPQAETTNALWEHLKNGESCITEIPAERWAWEKYFDEKRGRKGSSYTKWGGFLKEIDKFDPLFFQISPAEAEKMDPQERLFLEEAYASIEDAGYTPKTLSAEGRVGVFVGVMNSDYPSATSYWSIANRVSYLLNFQGPSLALDTACSSSLTAIHMALESLYSGTSECAIAGGVNLIVDPNHYLNLSEMAMLSASEQCRSYGAGADGFVDGEAVGAILLKPLHKAVTDGDHIYGVIKGSMLNAGGRTNGYTVPNPAAQFKVIAEAMRRAGVHARTISYIEGHGTGTALGDPVEVAGLTRAFGQDTEDKQFCALGSVKSNIGHCESAAGIAGVTKVLLQLRHGRLAPSLHAEAPNPEIDFNNTPFVVQRELAEWKRPLLDIDGEVREYPRRAGISSFGAGGANVHLIIEEHLPAAEIRTPAVTADAGPAVILLSARDEERLRTRARQLLSTLRDRPMSDVELADIAYTLQLGREAMEVRLAMTVDSIEALAERLQAYLEGKDSVDGWFVGRVKRNQGGLSVLSADEDMATTLDAWMAKGKYAKLLELWVNGLEVDWRRLYGESTPRRVSLPTYPFAKERYWIAKPQASFADESQMVSASESQVDASLTPTIGTLLLRPEWDARTIDGAIEPPTYAQHLVVLCAVEGIAARAVEERLPGATCLEAATETGGIAARYESAALRVFEVIQSVLRDKPRGRVLLQVVVPAQGEAQVFAGLVGLLKTAALENPKLTVQLLEVAAAEERDGLAEKLKLDSRYPADQHIRYADAQRWVAGWREIDVAADFGAPPWKKEGVYLISGGAGGLGRLFAREIVEQAPGARLILTGRSALSEEKQAQLEALGGAVVYRQVDIAQAEAVEALLRDIRGRYGRLDGIIHSAGVIHDNFILNKKREELKAVLAPKVAGLVNLDRASREQDLDVFILFSSGAGALGSPGQADYAVANAFMDRYAAYRNERAACGERRGHTLSLNWPLWETGGMHMDADRQGHMRQQLGMIAMSAPSGIGALYRSLASGQSQIMVMEGEIDRLRDRLARTAPSTQSLDHARLREKLLHRLKQLFSEVVKLDVDRIDAEEPLETYGIDSIMITQLNEKLESVFGEISKTLFYEYQTLEALGRYLVEDYPQASAEWTGLDAESQRAASAPVVRFTKESPVQEAPGVRKPVKGRVNTGDPVQTADEPIAIIGVSGRYPGARTLDEYWQNLKRGKDCIIEIPEERWPLEGFFEPDPESAVEQGKSYSKWGGFVDGYAEFDPLFFNIAPREAVNMDPQERLFLQACWEVLEDAGYTRESLGAEYERSVGVFAGITKTGFELYGLDLLRQGQKVYPHTSFSSVANRVSYLLNLHGPSMPIDTMCSSSLTAIHEACEHLYRNECEMAIAGGVNLYLHPTSYVGLCAKQMLSVDGRCKSFAQGGNGFVPGEGVGTVLLKRLSKAVEDDDHIYALIRATSINHGGKTNGYMVPNPVAQGELIREALDRAGVSAREVSYIEAHGTGTELGDPIEITGLNQAFRRDTRENRFCAIGSVKSNMGHLEAAAGIAGLTKILLQLKYGQLAPSLHAGELNPNINFDKSPFTVQRELSEWRRPVFNRDGETREYPRVAGISSFGAGGSNAHLIIEEYRSPEPECASPVCDEQTPAVIVLSAKSEAQLRQQAERLLEAFFSGALDASSLADIAYTLQVGREAMAWRLALTAGTRAALREKLQAYVEGRSDIAELYRGQVTREQEKLSVFAADEELREAIEKWLRRKKYARLLELWVQGLAFNWDSLYNEVKPRRISLPTYPFANERYWFGPMEIQAVEADGATMALHPLLQENTSELWEQRYSSTFTGEEFFLADHRVNGRCLLPGVAYLEMAREAVARASGAGRGILLKNVVWARPVVAGDTPVRVHVGVFEQESGEIGYEIYSEADGGGAEPVVHSQGVAMLGKAGEAPRLDLQALRSACRVDRLTAETCYERFAAMGVDYGPAHRGLREVYVGEGEVVAKLVLPAQLAGTLTNYHLHPSLMDAALQSLVGFTASGRRQPTSIPFALDSLEVHQAMAPEQWAYVRPSGSGGTDEVRKLDIDLSDEHGRVCVRMRGLTSRRVDGEPDTDLEATAGTLLFEPQWHAAETVGENQATFDGNHLVVLAGLGEVSGDEIEARCPGVRCITLAWEGDGIPSRYTQSSVQLLGLVRQLLQDRSQGEVLVQVVVPNAGEGRLLLGLGGLLKTATLEEPRVRGQLIEIPPRESVESLAARLRSDSAHPQDGHIRYAEGRRWLGGWREMEAAALSVEPPWRSGGVYLISGGAGGLGLLFAQAIVEQAPDARLILMGRSVLNAEKQARVGALGAGVEYRQVDVVSREAVAALLKGIRNDYGRVDGIIHAAGVNHDNFLLNKEDDELRQVLAPKVVGMVNLDQASREMDLDFFIGFSSLAGVLGNVGQADYAVANAFMDFYAGYRNDLAAAGERRGRSLSIAWPLWQTGGMHIDAELAAVKLQSAGLAALPTASGILALYQALAVGGEQVAVLAGDVARIRRVMALDGAWPESSYLPLRTLEGKPFDAGFFLSLSERIANGEVSEEQLAEILMA
ncbi:MAG: SDR family NAD(P)-dependent oxidoreductase [Candidatus Thiodiazotropha sp. (ex Dulcina madagascariensis)]|nr:SDR family NAD(P)-dependent oxidoreductase [Candidatus Thiodiazotropha sp. (ex Dulcina madagascariensis)]